MDYFNYRGDDLFAEDLKVADLATTFGTPLYVYSKATLTRHVKAFDDSLSDIEHLICFAVKANGSLAILNLMARLGCGFDVVSEGELRRVIAAGGDPHKVVFSGVGKTAREIEFALKQGIKCLNIESKAELEVVKQVAAELKLEARIAFRVNPNVDAKTHPSISTGLKHNKFGIPIDEVVEVYQQASQCPYLKVSGIDCHIGSQMTSGAPLLEATDKLISLYEKLKNLGINIDHIDLGGGLGVTYDAETPPSPADFFGAIKEKIAALGVAIFIEPGRAMVANAGIFVSKCLYLKDNGEKHFCIVDGGMNDLIRPALYGSVMTILNCQKQPELQEQVYDVVGPVCESDDFLGKERKLQVKQGDFLVVRGAGAYGSSMSSVYNGRPLCCEVLVDQDKVYEIRHRQRYEELWQNEILLED
ncbi:MAG: diaminopimelate decarboxylase [Succinivibrio sp.]|nr:diaminopimelate decarboxylase [Succinivibrio sp.]